MGEAKKDDLHALIHCLDPAEKGHFSKYAQRYGVGEANNYEHLFQLLAKQQEYDPESIAAEMKRLKIATPLAAAKNHLKTMLFQALRDYNSSRDTHTCLLEGLGNLAILYEKKQYDLLRKELKRLKKIAELHAEHHILFKIGDYERKLHKETARRDIVEGMEEILSEMQLQAKGFQNQMQFEHLFDKMFVVASKSGSDREQAVNAILAADLLAAEENAITLQSRIYFHQIHATAHMLKGQYEAAQRKYGAVLSLWEGAPHLIEEFPSRYRRILSNYLRICSQTGDFALFAQLLTKVRNSPSGQLADKAEIFHLGYTSELVWRIETYDWKGVAAMIPQLEAGIAAYESILSQRIILPLYYHLAIFYFLGEDYTACRNWVRIITEAPRTEQRMDIQRFAKVLWLLLLWLKRDFDLLEYEHRSVVRYFENWGSGALEQSVLDLVQALVQAENVSAQRVAFEAFVLGASSPDKKGVLGYLVLRAWAIGQLTGTSPREVIGKI